MQKRLKVLAIETSCDETAAAIVSGFQNQGAISDTVIHSNVVASQAALHERFGGVFPEVAAREHVKAILPTIRLALHEGLGSDDPAALRTLNALAVTVGPGLIGSLLVGVETANALALSSQLPLVGINHMAGHFYSTFVPKPLRFPVLALLVSGGHTQLVWSAHPNQFKILGTTRDDAVGEAFDKAAALLGLPYPGGSQIEHLAHNAEQPTPFPVTRLEAYAFSYSGLKTALRREMEKHPHPTPGERANLAAGFQEAALKQLVEQTRAAASQHQPATVVVGGGVSINKQLREKLSDALSPLPVHFPDPALTGDNAAMIGVAALWHSLKQPLKERYDLKAEASLQLA
jgi:N6-L-threonylcarbamoyladenine synthase